MKATFMLPLLLLCAGTGTAHGQVFIAALSGAAEASPNLSPGTGSTTVTYNSLAKTLTLDVEFSGLEGTTTAAHIHAPTATAFSGAVGVALEHPSFSGFPLGVSAGTYNMTLDLTLTSIYNSTFLNNNGGTAAGAEAALIAAITEGKAYLNIHSSVYGSGEIRGFLAPVPEPGETMAATGLVLGAAALWRRRARRATPAA